MPFGLTLEASWVPPVRIHGVKANLFGVSLEKAVGRPDGLVAALRAHATFGSINAPITCDDAALADPLSECFGGTRSDDKVRPNIIGVDLAVGGPVAHGRFRPYAGVGYNRLEPRFQVNLTNQFGELDNRRVEVGLNRVVLFGGATWTLTNRLGITSELYAAPADAITGRVVLRTSIGP